MSWARPFREPIPRRAARPGPGILVSLPKAGLYVKRLPSVPPNPPFGARRRGEEAARGIPAGSPGLASLRDARSPRNLTLPPWGTRSSPWVDGLGSMPHPPPSLHRRLAHESPRALSRRRSLYCLRFGRGGSVPRRAGGRSPRYRSLRSGRLEVALHCRRDRTALRPGAGFGGNGASVEEPCRPGHSLRARGRNAGRGRLRSPPTRTRAGWPFSPRPATTSSRWT